MLIKNYGHLWDRRLLSFGEGRKKGHLKGRKGRVTVDFREQIGVYVLYTADLTPMYVGQAGNKNASLFKRLSQHNRDHLQKRWLYFSWFGLRGVDKAGNLIKSKASNQPERATKEALLNEFEAILMTVLEPNLNKQGPRWLRGQVAEYQQFLDEALKPVTGFEVLDRFEDIEDDIAKLHDMMLKTQKRKKN